LPADTRRCEHQVNGAAFVLGLMLAALKSLDAVPLMRRDRLVGQ